MEDSAQPNGSPSLDPQSEANTGANSQSGSEAAVSPGAGLWSIQWKILLLTVLIGAAILSAMLWKTNSLLTEDKIAFVNDAAMKQIAPLKRLVQQRLADEKSALISFAGTRLAVKTSVSGGNFGDFDVISLVQNVGTGQWTPGWVERNPTVREDRWPTGHDQTLLKSLPYGRIRDGETLWIRVSDRQGSPVYAMMISVEIQSANAKDVATRDAQNLASSLPETAEQILSNAAPSARAVLVGFTTANPLAEVTEDFIGSTNTVYIVDDRGYIASHVNKSYQGALFSDDPLVRDILHGRKSGATGKFEDLESRSVLGHYERIEHSNLFAVITTPESVLSSMVGSQRFSAIQTGLAAFLLCIAFGVFLSRIIAKQALAMQLASVAPLREALVPDVPKEQIQSVEPVTPKVQTPIVTSETQRVLTDNLVRALTEPLHGILGHASLVRAKAENDEIENHADSIAREARRMRDLVERIHKWEDHVSTPILAEPINVNEILNRCLKKREGELASENIHVLRELRPVPHVQGSTERMERAIDQIIDNAFEALRGRMAKRIKIESETENSQVIVRITDTGVGMSRDIRDRAFEPFTKDFQTPTRTGLGLSEVAATVKAMGGTHAVESTPGEGALFILTFPVTEAETALFAEQERVGFTHPTPKPPVAETPKITESAPVVEAPLQAASTEDAAVEAVPETASVNTDREPYFEPQIQAEILDLDDEPEDEIRFDRPLAAPIHTAEEPISTGPLMLDELDDDDEIFANVPLSKAMTRPTKVSQVTEPPRPVVTKAPEKFEVKIRKPRPRRPTERDLE